MIRYLLDDYIIAGSAAVIVATAIILANLLYRYNKLVQEANKSTSLAKDVWDSVNSRFSVVDARIIDLMAKSDVLSSRLTAPQSGAAAAAAVGHFANDSSVVRISTPAANQELGPSKVAASRGGTDTELKLLRLLADGPKTSAQIRQEVGKSREHTSRMMKILFDRGLVIRNDRNKPYVYEITESGKSHLTT